MKIKTLIIIIVVAILIFGGGFTYWYFVLSGNYSSNNANSSTTPDQQTTFQPFGTSSSPSKNATSSSLSDSGFISPVNTNISSSTKIPTLRLLSNTPVGGFGATTTSSSTVVRWVDRGRGNVFESDSNTLDIKTISNAVVPMFYTSIWNKDLTAFIGSIFNKDSSAVDTIYTEITKRVVSTSTASSTQSSDYTSLTDYQLKGKNLPENTIGFAVSPKKDKVFILVNENGSGVGYVSGFDGKVATKIFQTPLTQLNVDWPADNVIALTTKGSSDFDGYLYFVDPKTGIWSKVYGPARGLSTKVSHDAKRVFISSTGTNKNIRSSVLTIKDGSVTDATIRTLADKCVWGNFDKQMIYCATPSKIDSAIYPDDWYVGSVSFIDKIWQLNTETGEIHMVSQITNSSDRVIDAYNLVLDNKDNFLFFMNKNDLSLWSLDLI